MVPEFAHPRRVGRGVQLAVNEPLHPIRPLTVPAGMRTTMRWRRPSPIAAADTRSASSITCVTGVNRTLDRSPGT